MPIIKKANEILRRGYVPSRGDEAYEDDGCFNCLFHACFNFTNKQLAEFDTYSVEFFLDNHFANFDCDSLEETKSYLLKNIEKTGLKIEKYVKGSVLKNNQWKVAMYFSQSFKTNYGIKGYHFLLEEKDGTWSGKNGTSTIVEKFEKPEQFIPWALNNKYELDDILVLTNPYVRGGEVRKRDYYD